jgi:hypothetical protein
LTGTLFCHFISFLGLNKLILVTQEWSGDRRILILDIKRQIILDSFYDVPEEMILNEIFASDFFGD